MLRRFVLLGLAATALVLAAAGSGAASATGTLAYVGEWTPNSSSDAATHGITFTVATADESTARLDSGSESINFDDYCKSNGPGVQPVSYFKVNFSTGGVFGGCVSGKTGGHLYAWAPGEIWYGHYAWVKGEPELIGVWEPTGNRDVSDKFTALHPLASFAVHVKYTVVGKKGGKAAELISATGAGGVFVSQSPPNCLSEAVLGGFGGIAVRIVTVGGPNVVELDAVTVKLAPTAGTFQTCDTTQALKAVPVVVASSDPHEKDGCPVGSPGSLYLGDRSAKYKGDTIGLEVAKCHLAVSLTQGNAKKGSHVAVAMTFEENG
ncbi:MAG TPA: hypothetical protein VFA37_02790 [Gaiellaceae bacterium]|nr:hypothetical protein [Gaiellaceae bacterium]